MDDIEKFQKCKFLVSSDQLQIDIPKNAQMGIMGNFQEMDLIYVQLVWDSFWPLPFLFICQKN